MPDFALDKLTKPLTCQQYPEASINRALIWSPDGKYIAYGSQRDRGNPPLLNIISINTHEFFQIDMEPYITLGGWSAYFDP